MPGQKTPPGNGPAAPFAILLGDLKALTEALCNVGMLTPFTCNGAETRQAVAALERASLAISLLRHSVRSLRARSL